MRPPIPWLEPSGVHGAFVALGTLALALCVYTTVALLAWILTPALMAAVFGAVAFRAYWKSWRAGLRRSDCLLRDPRLVMLYLALIVVAGVAFTVLRVLRLFGKV